MNPRPHGPEPCAIPNFATPRNLQCLYIILISDQIVKAILQKSSMPGIAAVHMTRIPPCMGMPGENSGDRMLSAAHMITGVLCSAFMTRFWLYLSPKKPHGATDAAEVDRQFAADIRSAVPRRAVRIKGNSRSPESVDAVRSVHRRSKEELFRRIKISAGFRQKRI